MEGSITKDDDIIDLDMEVIKFWWCLRLVRMEGMRNSRISGSERQERSLRTIRR